MNLSVPWHKFRVLVKNGQIFFWASSYTFGLLCFLSLVQSFLSIVWVHRDGDGSAVRCARRGSVSGHGEELYVIEQGLIFPAWILFCSRECQRGVALLFCWLIFCPLTFSWHRNNDLRRRRTSGRTAGRRQLPDPTAHRHHHGPAQWGPDRAAGKCGR